MTRVLPTGWEQSTLKDVCHQISAGGDKPSNFSQSKTSSCKIPVYANGEKNDGLLGFTDIPTIEQPAITVAARGTIGFTCKRLYPYCPIVRLISLIPNQEKISLDFLYYFLKYLIPTSSGTSIPQLTLPMIKRFHIDYPSCIDEQKRIVEKLDKIFADIDKAKENTKKNLANAKEVFNSILSDIFTKNATNCDQLRVQEVTKIYLGLTHTPVYMEAGIPFLSVKNISTGKIDFKDTKFISEDEYFSLPDGAKPQKGDVLFARVGTLGCPSIVDTEQPFGTFVSLGFFRVNKNKILNTYIRYWMMSSSFWKQVEINVQGSTLKNLNTGWLKNFKITVPSLAEQQQIVEKIDALHFKTQELEQIYTKKLADLDELKQSVLQQAFSGKL